jgi:hypothetical protein
VIDTICLLAVSADDRHLRMIVGFQSLAVPLSDICGLAAGRADYPGHQVFAHRLVQEPHAAPEQIARPRLSSTQEMVHVTSNETGPTR